MEKDVKAHASGFAVSAHNLDEIRERLMLFFTRVNRSADAILHPQRADTLRGTQDVVASLHETKRIGLEIKSALERGDVDAMGHLLHEHWEVKKRRSQSISSGEIDRWYGLAREAGALGGKIVGAGGGGFLMVCCGTNAKPDVRAALTAAGLNEMKYDFDYDGAKVLVNF